MHTHCPHQERQSFKAREAHKYFHIPTPETQSWLCSLEQSVDFCGNLMLHASAKMHIQSNWMICQSMFARLSQEVPFFCSFQNARWPPDVETTLDPWLLCSLPVREWKKIITIYLTTATTKTALNQCMKILTLNYNNFFLFFTHHRFCSTYRFAMPCSLHSQQTWRKIKDWHPETTDGLWERLQGGASRFWPAGVL